MIIEGQDELRKPPPRIRPGWDEYFLSISDAVSSRAACLRRQVGAVLTLDNKIVATGYNGAAPNAPHCSDGACPRGTQSYEGIPSLSAYTGAGSCIAIHAEHNALNQFMQGRPDFAEQLVNCVMYINHKPCDDCVDLMCTLSLKKWVYRTRLSYGGLVTEQRWPHHTDPYSRAVAHA